jgi:GT2 family glycosyltransferase
VGGDAGVSSGACEFGLIAIGRNEGERLERCLNSALQETDRVVYVDSGSTDGSVAFARSLGVEVVELDTALPFTAARARNRGIARLVDRWPDVEYIQVVDGDCEFAAGWFARAAEFLDGEARCGVVCGRRRERHPDASIYNRLTDLEWDTPVGVAKSCGGDAVFRRTAIEKAGGYRDSLIAGEEPELCVRLRAAGWTVHRLDAEMTLHDAAMTRFSQYWKRAKRAGHAYAEGAAIHGRGPDRHGVKQVRSALVWGLGLPLVAVAAAWWTFGVSVLVWPGLWGVQAARIMRMHRRAGRSGRDAWLAGVFTMLAKPAQAMGVLLYWRRRLTGARATLIEYKGAAAATGGGGRG